MDGTVLYDDETDTYYADCDWSETAPSTEVVAVVAAALDRSPLDVPPLYDSVDPDALDLLVADQDSGPDSSPGDSGAGGPAEMTFAYAGCRVTVDAGGRVSTRRLDD